MTIKPILVHYIVGVCGLLKPLIKCCPRNVSDIFEGIFASLIIECSFIEDCSKHHQQRVAIFNAAVWLCSSELRVALDTHAIFIGVLFVSTAIPYSAFWLIPTNHAVSREFQYMIEVRQWPSGNGFGHADIHKTRLWHKSILCVRFWGFDP